MSEPERPTLLVVDDTPDNLTLMSGLLRDLYKVKVANGGERALKIAASDAPPDLILLDIMMPEMDGYEVCRRLKADPKTADIPVVFLTAKSEEQDEMVGLGLGAVDYITKPISPPIVMARVKTHLTLKRVSDFLRDQNAFLESEVQRRTEELLQSTLQRQLLENDLRVARKLQDSMLPPLFHQLGAWQLGATLQPARMIGGDLYDFFPLPGQRLLFAIGDVSDKGVAAALYMVRVLTLLRWLAPESPDPGALLGRLNDALCLNNDACMFVTLGCGFLDTTSGQVSYASAGHPVPLLLESGRMPRPLECQGGPALGLIEGVDFQSTTCQLASGQGLLMITDGVDEANNPGREEFGLERLITAVGRSLASPSQVMGDALQAVEAFTAGADPHDDLTMLVVLRPPT